jgi:hypothetical protein
MKTPHLILFFSLVTSTWFTAAENTMRERMYVQTDKQTYLSGEMVWMKAYLTDGKGIPGSLSRVSYVELHDGTSPVIQMKMEMANGTGSGWMELPVALPSGYYSLVAYTRYMRNEDERVFFRKTIAVVNPFRTGTTTGIDTTPPQALPPLSAPEATISVDTDRQTYVTRSGGEVRLQGLPSGLHSLSLSVSGKDLPVDVPEMDINVWHRQLPLHPQPVMRTAFLPEYEGHIIEGRLVDTRTGEPPQERTFSFLSFPGDQIRLFGGQPGTDGNVAFYTTRITGMHEAATLTLPGATGKAYRVDIQSPFSPLQEMQQPVFKMNPSWEEELLQRSVALQALYIYTPDFINQTDTSYSYFLWAPDRTYLLDEYTRFPTMGEVVSEFVLGLGIRQERGRRYMSVLREDQIGQTLAGSSANSLVLLDGLPVWDHDFICNYDPLSVRKIDIYRGSYFFGGQYFDGIVFFTTFSHSYPGWKPDETAQIINYEGTQAQRFFRYPSYQRETDRKSPVPDLRHTLLWMPEVDAGRNPSVTIPFTTSDYTGEFQITVEGLTREGEPVRGTASFEVR